jgi:hypothetical protein
MSHPQTKSFPSLTGLVSIVLTSTALVLTAPWLHEEFMPAIGLGMPWDFAAVLVLSFLC